MNHYRFCSLIFLEEKINEFEKRIKAFSRSCPFYQYNIKSDWFLVTNTFVKVTLNYNDFYVSLSHFEKINNFNINIMWEISHISDQNDKTYIRFYLLKSFPFWYYTTHWFIF